MATSLSLRIRQNTAHGNLCDLWILGQEGPAEFGLMHGTVSLERAALLEQALGLPVTREIQPQQCADDAIERSAARTQAQQTLFS